MQHKTLLSLLLILTLAACTSRNIVIKGLDFDHWKKDKNGCSGYRNQMHDLLTENKEALLSYSEKDIISNMGTPDKAELIDRSEKFYVYDLSGGEACETTDATYTYLRIRFNSLGYAKEVLVLKDKI